MNSIKAFIPGYLSPHAAAGTRSEWATQSNEKLLNGHWMRHDMSFKSGAFQPFVDYSSDASSVSSASS
jgi:hypothetical protein